MRISDWSSDVCSADLRHEFDRASRRPAVAVAVLLAAGIAFGAGARTLVGFAEVAMLQQHSAEQAARLADTQAQAQRDPNAKEAPPGDLAARVKRVTGKEMPDGVKSGGCELIKT